MPSLEQPPVKPRPNAEQSQPGQEVHELGGPRGVVLQAERKKKEKAVEPWTKERSEISPALTLALETQPTLAKKVKQDLLNDQLGRMPEIPPTVAEVLLASGRWYPLSKLGAGGMATVYKAYDLNLRKFAALKVMMPVEHDLVYHDELTQRFEREAKSLAKLQHENVVTVYDAAYTPDGGYIALDFVAGGDLKQELFRNGKFSQADVAEIGLEIVAGLRAMHKSGVLHRDLKTDNILHNKDTGRYQITDFGLVIGVEAEQESQSGKTSYRPIEKGLTDPESYMGSPGFSAPEQITAQALSPATDAWALGVILYNIATGKLPFVSEQVDSGKWVSEVINRTVHDEPQAPVDIVPTLSQEMNELILSLLNKKPENRPSLENVAKRLRAIVEAEGQRESSALHPVPEAEPQSGITTERNPLSNDTFAVPRPIKTIPTQVIQPKIGFSQPISSFEKAPRVVEATAKLERPKQVKSKNFFEKLADLITGKNS